MRTLMFLVLWGGAYIIGLSLPPAAAGYFWTVTFLGFSAYCAINFARCREVHCLITAPGYFFFGLLGLLKTWALVNVTWDTIWFDALLLTGIAYFVQCSHMCATGSAYLKKREAQ
jgi:hypothetical protein